MEEVRKLKINARATLNYAVKEGLIQKPDTCPNCGSTKRIEGHHEDYSKPLKVKWLCHSCHLASEHPIRLDIPIADRRYCRYHKLHHGYKYIGSCAPELASVATPV